MTVNLVLKPLKYTWAPAVLLYLIAAGSLESFYTVALQLLTTRYNHLLRPSVVQLLVDSINITLIYPAIIAAIFALAPSILILLLVTSNRDRRNAVQVCHAFSGDITKLMDAIANRWYAASNSVRRVNLSRDNHIVLAVRGVGVFSETRAYVVAKRNNSSEWILTCISHETIRLWPLAPRVTSRFTSRGFKANFEAPYLRLAVSAIEWAFQNPKPG